MLATLRRFFEARKTKPLPEQRPAGLLTVGRGLEIVDRLANALENQAYVNGFMRLSTVGAATRLELAQALYIRMASDFEQTFRSAPSSDAAKSFDDFVKLMGGVMFGALWGPGGCLPDGELSHLAALQKGTPECYAEKKRLNDIVMSELERGDGIAGMDTIDSFVDYLRTLNVSACHYWPQVYERIGLEYPNANQLYLQAAEEGHADAQYYMGLAYSGHPSAQSANSEAVTKDHEQAVKWFRKAAEHGGASAQYELGLAYDYGRGVPQDDAEAAKWYRKAAEQGSAGAQCNLGYAHEHGKGATQDHVEAAKWYRKAAEQGDRNAQYNLGLAHAVGRGVAKDDAEAVKWVRMAADQGHAQARLHVG